MPVTARSTPLTMWLACASCGREPTEVRSRSGVQGRTDCSIFQAKGLGDTPAHRALHFPDEANGAVGRWVDMGIATSASVVSSTRARKAAYITCLVHQGGEFSWTCKRPFQSRVSGVQPMKTVPSQALQERIAQGPCGKTWFRQ